MNNIAHKLPASDHFQLHRLADGVYAAIATAKGAAGSNAGIIDLGDRTLIFDTFMTPLAASDLRQAGEDLTGREALLVVNSHCHSDHWCGNQIFAPHASIVSTGAIRDLMLADIDEWMQPMIDDPSELETSIAELQDRVEKEPDDAIRRALTATISGRTHIRNSLPSLSLVPPSLTFESELDFHGSRRSAQLRSVSNCHSACDLYLALPEDKMIFTGDLAFHQSHPYLLDGDCNAWAAALDQMIACEFKQIVPGHGSVCTVEALSFTRDYVLALQQLAVEIIEAGGSSDDAANLPIPPPFDGWFDGMTRFERNMRGLYQKLKG